VQLTNGQTIPTFTTIWTAGLEAAVPETTAPLQTTPQGKIPVRSTLQLHGHEQVYAIGDAAYVEQWGKPLTGVAPEALQQGVAVARNLKRQLQGKTPEPFRYFNKGRLAIIGCYAGVGQIAGVPITGFLPWLLWLGVHLVYLPGVRNRLVVLITWLHGYLMGDRAVRQILSTEHRNRTIELQSISKPR
jgi:NADH:ubiquinone reductase (H+-translocating)